MKLPLSSAAHQRMRQALKDHFAPGVRKIGFKGSLPHFQRWSGNLVDLISIQFDKYGGGFSIEVAHCDYSQDFAGKPDKKKVNAWYLPFKFRHTLPEKEFEGIRYDTYGIIPPQSICDQLALVALELIYKDGQGWLERQKAESGPRD